MDLGRHVERPSDGFGEEAVRGYLLEPDLQRVDRVVENEGGRDGRGEVHRPVDAVAPVRKQRVVVGQLGSPLGQPRGHVAPRVGTNVGADPFAVGIVGLCGLARGQTAAKVLERDFFGRAGVRQVVEPCPSNVIDSELRPVLLQDQQAEEGGDGVVVGGDAVHAITGKRGAGTDAVAELVGPLDLAPVALGGERVTHISCPALHLLDRE